MTPPPQSQAAEIKRRIQAARILRGMKQEDLQAALAEEGFGKRELGRIERGKLPLTKIRRDVLTGALGVPERWFTASTVDEVVGIEPGSWAPSPALADQISALEQVLVEAGQGIHPGMGQDGQATRGQGPRDASQESDA